MFASNEVLVRHFVEVVEARTEGGDTLESRACWLDISKLDWVIC